MTLRSLSSNLNFGGLLRDTLRRQVWAIAIAVLGFLFTLPLPVAMILQNSMTRGYDNDEFRRASVLGQLQSMFGVENPFVKVIMVLLAIVCGIALFSYLQSRQKTDFFHSLPISRGALFGVHFTAGVCVVVPAYLGSLLLGGVIATAAGYGAAFWSLQMLGGVALNLTFFLLLYAISALCTVLCGNLVVTLLLLGWALLSPIAAVGLSEVLRSIFFKTFVGGGRLTDWIATRLSPMLQYFRIMETRGGDGFYLFGSYGGGPDSMWPLVLGYLIAAAAFIALGYALYRARKSERAGSAIAFQGLKAPLKFWCVTVVAVAMGFLFAGVMNEFWMYIGFAIGAVLTHMLMEIIYAFDFRAALRHLKPFAVYAVLFALCAVGLNMDITGFDSYVPETDDIAAVAVSLYDGQSSLSFPEEGFADLTDPANIEAVRTLARMGVDDLTNEPLNRSSSGLAVRFLRKNGTRVERRYNIYDDENDTPREGLAELMSGIRYSPEYLDRYSPVTRFELTGHDRLFVYTRKAFDRSYENSEGFTDDAEQVAEIVRTLRREQQTLTAEEAHTTAPVLAVNLGTLAQEGDSQTMSYGQGQRYSNITSGMTYVYPSYTETLALLDRYTGVRPEALGMEAVRSAELHLYGVEHEVEGAGLAEAEAERVVNDKPVSASSETVIVTDAADLAALLRDAVPGDWAYNGFEGEPYVLGGHGFEVILTLKDGRSAGLFYPSGKAPEAVFAKYFSET